MFVKFLFLPPFEKKNFVELRADKTKKQKTKNPSKNKKTAGESIRQKLFCGFADFPIWIRSFHMSHEKNPLTFHYTGWLIGILIMAYYSPYITR